MPPLEIKALDSSTKFWCMGLRTVCVHQCGFVNLQRGVFCMFCFLRVRNNITGCPFCRPFRVSAQSLSQAAAGFLPCSPLQHQLWVSRTVIPNLFYQFTLQFRKHMEHHREKSPPKWPQWFCDKEIHQHPRCNGNPLAPNGCSQSERDRRRLSFSVSTSVRNDETGPVWGWFL